jgi:hypothetical protein
MITNRYLHKIKVLQNISSSVLKSELYTKDKGHNWQIIRDTFKRNFEGTKLEAPSWSLGKNSLVFMYKAKRNELSENLMNLFEIKNNTNYNLRSNWKWVYPTKS